MTPKEFETILNAMSDSEFDEFKKEWGGDRDKNRAWHVRNYGQCQDKYDVPLSRLVGAQTEAEKAAHAQVQVLKATVETAQEAKVSNELASDANHIARAANNLSQKANQKAEDANVLSVQSKWVSIAALVVACIAVVISLFKQ